jgi:hypothetical protein
VARALLTALLLCCCAERSEQLQLDCLVAQGGLASCCSWQLAGRGWHVKVGVRGAADAEPHAAFGVKLLVLTILSLLLLRAASVAPYMNVCHDMHCTFYHLCCTGSW